MKQPRSARKRVPVRPSGFLSNRTYLIATILGSAVIARIITMVLAHDSFLWQGIWSDAATYNQWARRIVANGDWLGSEPFFMSPLYAYVLAAVYTVFGESLLAVRVMQAAAGSATAVLLFLIGEKLFSRKAGFIAGLLAAVYGPFLLSNVLLLVETLKVFFLVLAFWLLLVAEEKPGRLWWVAAGGVLGCAALCRPTDLLLLPVVAIWILVIRRKSWPDAAVKLAAVAAGVVLLIAPVTIRNYVVSGEFVPITSNGGLNFYIGNNHDAVGVYYNVDRLDLANDPDGRVYLEAETGQPLRHSEVSGIWMNKALAFVANEPWAFIALLGKKLLLFFHHREISQLGYNYLFVQHYAIPLLAATPGFVIAGSLGLLGMVLAAGRWKRWFLLYGFLGAEILGVVLFFVTDRFRLSAIPFFLLFSGFAVVEIAGFSGRHAYRRIALSVAVVGIALAGMTFLNQQIPDEYSLEWEYVGLLSFNTGNNQEALQAFQEAGKYKDSFHLRNNIGNVYLAMGRAEEAINQFQAGHRMNPSQAISTFSIGTAYASRQDWMPALAAFDRAIEINPRFAPAYLNRGLVLFYQQQFEEALEALKTYATLEPDKSKLASVYGDIRNLEQIVAQRRAEGSEEGHGQ